MPTRLKKPSIWRPLALAAGLVAFQVYLGFNVVSGVYGIESNDQLLKQIDDLEARSGALAAEISSVRHRVELFNTLRLDPDLLSERARALLGMAQADDVIVMIDPLTGLPEGSSLPELASSQLTDLIAATSMH